MLKSRRRHLSLLEVLICFTLIVLCLFPLLSPHVTYYQTQRKLAQRIDMNFRVSNWYASFYEQLLKKEITWDSLPFKEPQVIEELKASYIVSLAADKIGDKESLYLLEVLVETEQRDKFTYYFVVKRKNDEDQEATPNPA